MFEFIFHLLLIAIPIECMEVFDRVKVIAVDCESQGQL